MRSQLLQINGAIKRSAISRNPTSRSSLTPEQCTLVPGQLVPRRELILINLDSTNVLKQSSERRCQTNVHSNRESRSQTGPILY